MSKGAEEGEVFARQWNSQRGHGAKVSSEHETTKGGVHHVDLEERRAARPAAFVVRRSRVHARPNSVPWPEPVHNHDSSFPSSSLLLVLVLETRPVRRRRTCRHLFAVRWGETTRTEDGGEVCICPPGWGVSQNRILIVTPGGHLPIHCCAPSPRNGWLRRHYPSIGSFHPFFEMKSTPLSCCKQAAPLDGNEQRVSMPSRHSFDRACMIAEYRFFESKSFCEIIDLC